MGKAQFEVTPELIAEALQMPTDAVIVGAVYDRDRHVIILTANDPALPESEPPPLASPICTRERVRWDWNLQ